MLTAGLRCAPETVPMNKMIAMTIRAGATTKAGAGMAWPPNFAFTIPPPAATRTSRKVPKTSENRRRPSYLSSKKSNCLTSAFGRPDEPSRASMPAGTHGAVPG